MRESWVRGRHWADPCLGIFESCVGDKIHGFSGEGEASGYADGDRTGFGAGYGAAYGGVPKHRKAAGLTFISLGLRDVVADDAA